MKKELTIPSIPNFIRTADGEPVPIEDLTDDQLREIGRQWTDSLLVKSRHRGIKKIDEALCEVSHER